MALTLPVPASPQYPQAALALAARSLQPMRQRWQRRSDPVASSEVTADGGKRLATVAVIGGGVAGLACARRLGALGFKATVFDTGKRGPGGRASSRTWRGQVCDHASQFVTTTDKDFAELLTSSGAVRPFGKDGRFGTLSKANFEALQDGIERWIGLEGMGGIVRMLAEGLDIQQDVWVPPSNGLQCSRSDGRWGITVPAGPQGGREVKWFDAAVIAHNGKCAERLTSSTPAQEVHALLRTNFACSLPRNPRPGSGRFTLNQIYSLLFEVPSGLMPASFDAAFVEDEPILRWLSSNTAKLRQGGDGEVWTALSSAPFGKQHKAPQEFLEGTPKETEVVELMLGAVERAVGLAKGILLGKVRATKLQLWGAALPITRWASRDAVDFAWSACHRIGIAGDWLSATPARASTIEAAWLSGVRLAEHIARAGEEDAGIQLGQDGGVFLPVEADFGAAAGEAVWVTEPADEPKGKGKGRGSGKGWKGKAAKSSR